MAQSGDGFIGGTWTPLHGEEFGSVDPSTGQTHWTGRSADRDDVSSAIDSAFRSQHPWRRQSFDQRARVINAFAELIAADPWKGRLASAISVDSGKPNWEAQTEVAATSAKVAASLAAHRLRADEIRRPQGDGESVTRFVPVGVVLVIGPYNFPLHMANGHIVPALLAGNAVVFKPSPLVPFAAAEYIKAWEAAGLPSGLLNLIQGGVDAAEFAIADERVNAVCFTGSRRAGVSIHRSLAGRPEMVSALEMGGNSPLVVWDYESLDSAVFVAVQSAFITAGQRCNCARRLIISEQCADEFIDRLVKVTRRLRIGPPTVTPEPFMGPVISEETRTRVLEAQPEFERAGCNVLLRASAVGDDGFFVSPSIVEITGRANPFGDEEVFGPLLTVERVETLDEAVDRCNSTRYGLAAGIIAQDRRHFDMFVDGVDAGLINWNQQLTGASGMAPFGGRKASGNHRPAGFTSVDYVTDAIALIEVPHPALPASLPPGMDFSQ